MHTTTLEHGMRSSIAIALAARHACSSRAESRKRRAADTAKAADRRGRRAGHVRPSAGETDSMKTPESVRYDADLDVFFVSNINGNPSEKDGNGFIARRPTPTTRRR